MPLTSLHAAPNPANPNKTMTPKTENMNEMWGDTAVKPLTEGSKAQWFKASKYALFIHWSLFSNRANRWGDQTLYGINPISRSVRPNGCFRGHPPKANP